MAAFRRAQEGGVYLVNYAPAEGCFYQGDDPFHQARQTPGLLWGGISPREPWPSLEALDAYRCVLDFHVLSSAPLDALLEHYQAVPDQIQIVPVPDATPVEAAPAPPLPAPTSPITPNPGHVELAYVALATQRGILALPDDSPWKPGRILAAAATISACLKCLGSQEAQAELEAVAEAPGDARALLSWLDGFLDADAAAP